MEPVEGADDGVGRVPDKSSPLVPGAAEKQRAAAPVGEDAAQAASAVVAEGTTAPAENIAAGEPAVGAAQKLAAQPIGSDEPGVQAGAESVAESGAGADSAPDTEEETDSGLDDETGDEAPGEPTLSEVLLAVEELWPESLAEDWDRVGLVAGHPNAQISRIMFAVDPTLEVVDEALEWGAELLITHHPLMLKGVNSVAATSGKGKVVHRLIEGGCALLTIHTNGDSAVGGVSDVLADAFGLENVEPLMPAAHGLPEEGIGRVGDLPGIETLGDFAARVFTAMPAVAGGVRVAGDSDALVRRVAVCGGAGDSLFDAVRQSQADVYVTADLRHHPASEAREEATNGRPYLIDLSHFASEWLWLPAAATALENVLADQGFALELAVSQTNTDPWDFILTPGLSK